MRKETYQEKYQLKESDLIDLIKGKKLIFYVPDGYMIEIIPPNHGVNISCNHWELIKSYLMQYGLSFYNVEDLIKIIEEKNYHE